MINIASKNSTSKLMTIFVIVIVQVQINLISKSYLFIYLFKEQNYKVLKNSQNYIKDDYYYSRWINYILKPVCLGYSK
jgi:hypothetical protein